MSTWLGVVQGTTPPAQPAHSAGARIFYAACGKPESTADLALTGGFTLIKRLNGGTGSLAADTGQTYIQLFAKDAADNTTTAPTASGGSGGNSGTWISFGYSLDSGMEWADAIGANVDWVVGGTDTSSAVTALKAVLTAFISGYEPTAGDRLVTVGSVPSDAGSTLSAATASATGLSGGTHTVRSYTETNAGFDTAQTLADWAGFAGTASSGVDVEHTITGLSATGTLAAILLRETPSPTEADFEGTGALSVLASPVVPVTAAFGGSGALSVTAADASSAVTTTAAFGGTGGLSVSVTPVTPAELTARILDPIQKRAPTALVVTAAGAFAGRRIRFFYDSDPDLAYATSADFSGNLVATSIPVPVELEAGDHTLLIISDGDAGAERTATLSFTLLNDPATGHVVGPDADPVEVPEAIQADGHRHWVFQDLMPSGLGNYIFAHSPATSVRPDFERQLNARRSTANDGQVHVTEGVGVKYEWKITGFCFTEAEQTELEDWADLNRRFYVIDDFGEAWTVASTGVEIKPRKRSNLQVRGESAALTDWLAEYIFTMLVYDVDPTTPVEAP